MTAKTFTRFDRLSEDFARAKHDWFEAHKLKLILLADVPDKGAESIGRGVHSEALKHTAARDGRTTSINIEPVMVRANGSAIGPFAAAAIVNASTSSPIGFIALGKAITLEDGSSTEFKFPPDVVMVTV
jgi:hypothetical protein